MYTNGFFAIWWVRLHAAITYHLPRSQSPPIRSSPTMLTCYQIPDSNVYGANMGPTWVLSAPDGPLLAPWTLLSGMVPREHTLVECELNVWFYLQEKAFEKYIDHFVRPYWLWWKLLHQDGPHVTDFRPVCLNDRCCHFPAPRHMAFGILVR